MIARRVKIFRLAVGLAAALGCGWALASDPPPVADDTPAFQAPAEPLPDDAPAEPLAPEPASPLELGDALALALMRNAELAGFSWETRANEARALQAGRAPNPELDVRLYRLGERNNIQDVKRTRVMLSQVLELGGKPSRRVALAETERAIADQDYEATRIRVASTVTSSFVAVLGAQRRVESHRSAVEFFGEMRDTVLLLVGTGTVRSLDGLQVKRQAGLARIELQQAEAELSVARFKLAALWGNPSPQFTAALGDLERVYSIPDIDTVMQLAQGSPVTARWDAEVARGQAALALAKANRVPDLNIGAGVRWEEGQADPDYLLDFEIDLPLFDRKQGDIREAHYNLARARAEKRAAQAASSEGIAEFYFGLSEADARRLTMREEVLPAARATFEAYRIAGHMDSLDDLFDARRDLARAEAQYTDALVDYHQALAALESIVGRSLAEVE